jgi:hypothetical protein
MTVISGNGPPEIGGSKGTRETGDHIVETLRQNAERLTR